MSWEAAQWAEQCKTGKPSRKAVLLVLANAAINKPIIDRAGSAYQCHLSHDTLARRSDCSIDTAQRACVWLESQGLVLRELRYFRGAAHLEQLLFECAPGGARAFPCVATRGSIAGITSRKATPGSRRIWQCWSSSASALGCTAMIAGTAS